MESHYPPAQAASKAMCYFFETLAHHPLILALSQGERALKPLKALLPGEKGWHEGQLVAHHVSKSLRLDFSDRDLMTPAKSQSVSTSQD
jgi:hypothetical protein